MVEFKKVKQGATLTCKYTDEDEQGNKVEEKIVVKIEKVDDSEWVDYDSIKSSVDDLKHRKLHSLQKDLRQIY